MVKVLYKFISIDILLLYRYSLQKNYEGTVIKQRPENKVKIF